MNAQCDNDVNWKDYIHSHKHQTIKKSITFLDQSTDPGFLIDQERLRPLEIRFQAHFTRGKSWFILCSLRLQAFGHSTDSGGFGAVLEVLDTHVGDSLFTSESFTPRSLRVPIMGSKHS